MSILVIVGTKAQFIKTAPVLREMDRRGVRYRLVYTGQHSETFDVLEHAFGTRQADEVLVPSFEADTKMSFARWSGLFWRHVLGRLRSAEWREASLCLVHGDTASTLFGAIAARLAGIRVGHIEAGLRSPKRLDPFPEELIRRWVSGMTHVHFAPDGAAADNLARARGTVIQTGGNTLRDALSMALARMEDMPSLGGAGNYGVVSIHRNENLSNAVDFDLLMESVIAASSVLPLKFVLHPATRARIARTPWQSRLEAAPGLELMTRMDYPEFVRLLVQSRLLMTDGGSNQEEAAMLGLPTLLLRRATERGDGLGDSIELSYLDRGAIAAFVDKHAAGNWIIRPIPDASPSNLIVDWITDSLAEGPAR